jgi:valyl-tRNA synthetase
MRGLSPKTRADVAFAASVPDDLRQIWEAEADLIGSLANVDAIVFGEGADKTAPLGREIVVGQEMTVLVDEHDGIDALAEKARLAEKRAKAATDLERLEKKLSNEGFLAKAAPEIVEKDRAKAAELAEQVRLIDVQITALG